MNDRFKFRVFLKAHNQMCNVHTLHTGTNKVIISTRYGNSSVEINEYNILMQCTGLKDKNGTLIYEGDIVKHTSLYNGNLTGEVYWSSETLQYKLKLLYSSGEIYADRDLVYFVNKNSLEKIGNIYENKELLEDTECQK